MRKGIWCYFGRLAAASAAVTFIVAGGFGAAMAAEHDFGAYAVPVYSGRLSPPDFRHAPKSYRYFKTVLREGANRGVNFGGHYALIIIGCGAGCRSVTVVDVRSGRIFGFPLGGESYDLLSLHFRPDSRLIQASWWESGDNDAVFCDRQEFVLTGETFKPLSKSADRQPGRCPE